MKSLWPRTAHTLHCIALRFRFLPLSCSLPTPVLLLPFPRIHLRSSSTSPFSPYRLLPSRSAPISLFSFPHSVWLPSRLHPHCIAPPVVCTLRIVCSSILFYFVSLTCSSPSLRYLRETVAGPHISGTDSRATFRAAWQISKSIWPTMTTWLLLTHVPMYTS